MYNVSLNTFLHVKLSEMRTLIGIYIFVVVGLVVNYWLSPGVIIIIIIIITYLDL